MRYATDSAIKVGTGNDYSTDEQIIGTWIDGKPLYQKTFEVNSLGSGTKTIAHGISNIGTIVDIKAMGNDGNYWAFNFAATQQATYYVYVGTENINISCGKDMSSAS